MLNILDKFKIPTLLGLTIIILGIGAGLVLILQNQPANILTKASPDQTPNSIQITNIEDESLTISWQTAEKVPGFITFGINSPNEQTALDDRDTSIPQARNTHHITLKNLSAQTTYKYKIFSGKLSTDVKEVATASTLNESNNFNPVISTALQGDNPISEGIAYLSISGAIIQSAPIKDYGNFIISINKMRANDLLTIFIPKDAAAKITVTSNMGEASAMFKISNSNQPIGPLKIGQNIDLTLATPTPTTAPDLNIYDLDNNKVVNASDHAIILNNFGKNPKNEPSSTAYKKADLNKDGIVNQKDLDLMYKEILRLGQTLPSITPKP